MGTEIGKQHLHICNDDENKNSNNKNFGFYPTTSKTSIEQTRIENLVKRAYEKYMEENDSQLILFRKQHVDYLKHHLFTPLDSQMAILDTSRAWMVYWISLSLHILGESDFLNENCHKIISFVKKCESPKGGYGGGPQQEPHLASTYASVCSIVTIGTPKAFQSLNRKTLEKFIKLMQQPDGSFTLHENGEIDIRGSYCALVVAKLLDIPISSQDDIVKWILSCQTYEGGFGAAPGHEAHGGYTFCGVASLAMLDSLHLCDLNALLGWVVNKQLCLEGGFSGRTNKLVDVCYSFWNGAIIPIVQNWMTKIGLAKFDRWLFDQESLQKYIIACCQNRFGGLFDKPGKQRDFYHTCYALSGLSISQYSPEPIVFGVADNLVKPVHPVFNVPLESLCALGAFLENEPNTLGNDFKGDEHSNFSNTKNF